MQTEMRVGQAAREAATEMREAIRMADETTGSQSHTERLRLNKKDELSAAGLTKEIVLDHANKVSEMLKDVYDNVAHDVFDWTKPGPAKPTRYRNRQERRRWKDLHKYRAELKQALDTYNSKPKEAADNWHEELSGVVSLHRGKTSASFRQHFPPAPECPCDATWKQWTQACASEMSKAKGAQREAQKAPDQQSIEKQIKKTQSGYMRNQKKTHKMILGKGSQHSLGAVQDSDTKELHTDPEKIKESVQKFYQRLADHATSAGKTGAFLPEEAPRQYPWEHGPMKNQDHFDIETDVGKHGIPEVCIEDHIRDKSVLQRVLSHLSNNKTPGPDEIPNELLKHLPASMQDAIHQLFILMWMTSTTPDAWKQSETILLHKMRLC